MAEANPPAVAVEERDGVKLTPDGRALFVIEGKQYVLRLPRFGEFKQLRQALLAITVLPPTEQLDPLEQWVADMFGTLSDRPLPESTDDWPAWLANGDLPNRLLTHWRDVPLVPGSLPL